MREEITRELLPLVRAGIKRADKAKETLEIENKIDWDAYRERINAHRQRLAAAAKAAKK